jgi:hypothetical protein
VSGYSGTGTKLKLLLLWLFTRLRAISTNLCETVGMRAMLGPRDASIKAIKFF